MTTLIDERREELLRQYARETSLAVIAACRIILGENMTREALLAPTRPDHVIHKINRTFSEMAFGYSLSVADGRGVITTKNYTLDLDLDTFMVGSAIKRA